MTQPKADELKLMQDQFPPLELSDIDLSLTDRLADREFRKEWFRAELEERVPEAYKALRERRDLTQAELARLVGTKQSGISRFEKSSDASWQFDFLLRMAEALDARLRLVVEASEDVLGGYDEHEQEQEHAPDFAVFETASFDQRSTRSALDALGNINGISKRRELSGDLSGAVSHAEGRSLRTGASQRGDRKVQFSIFSRTGAAPWN